MNEVSIQELEARRALLLRQLRSCGPVIGGSLATVPRTCGNRSCRCMKGGAKHEAVILCRKEKGKSVATYVPKALHDDVQKWNDEHKRIKAVLKELSEIGEKIIKQYGPEKRRAKAVKASLKVDKPA